METQEEMQEKPEESREKQIVHYNIWETAILELLEIHKYNDWVTDIKLGDDDGGKTIDIYCDVEKMPSENNISRVYKGLPVCVMLKYKFAPVIKD